MILGLGYKKVILYGTLCVLLVLFLLPAHLMDRIYGEWIYKWVRYFFHLISFIPFPIVYLLILACIYLIFRLFRSTDSMKKKVLKLIIALLFVVLLFYALWAFNYRRPSFGSKFPLEKSNMDSLSWNEELGFAIRKISESRPAVIKEFTAIEVERLVMPYVKSICNDHSYFAPGKIRVKSLWPAGVLLRISTAGFYLPFTGEAYIDKGLLTFQIPYTLSHEMCHGYGVTDEGACNYLAYLALMQHPDSSIRYSADLAYFRYVAGEYRNRFPKAYQKVRETLLPTVRQDLDAINANFLKYPDIFPMIRDLIYDNYLQMQGIKEGIASYDNIIGYVRQGRIKGLIK